MSDSLAWWLRRWRLKPSRRQHQPGRNRSRLAVGKTGLVLVKLADPGLSLRQEASALDAFGPARTFSVPSCVRRDARGDAIAVEWIARATTLWQLHHRRRQPLELARKLGAAMAELHRPGWALPRAAAYDFGATMLWPTPDSYVTFGPASLELLARVQRDEKACAMLEWLSRRARAPELSWPIHGDLRLPNVLVRGGTLVLIDWDQAAWSDGALDAGSLLGEYLSEYFVPTGAGFSLPALRRFTGAMLGRYLDDARGDEWLPEAIIGWAAVALLRNVAVMAKGRTVLSREASHLLEAALRILSRPRDGLSQLAGLKR